METLGRLFVAVSLPEPTRDLLALVLSRWNDDRPLPGKVVPPRNWHLTLRFLGETEAIPYERFLSTLDQADLGSSFTVEFEGLGAFPRAQRASVLWIGVTRGAERLIDLAGAVEESARAAGFEPEERPFKPHLTLSRIRPTQDLRPLLDRPQPEAVDFTATGITIYRSHLGGGPPRYEIFDALDLD